ncbi:hypothetical protein V6N12_035057 [Hibiscus sabdariffa]|uniref:Uncharacterized protein n=1 Tax=Hibiscus sabdariffa TaxID=183260 RepID=A0ABR2AEW6_9ROSI
MADINNSGSNKRIKRSPKNSNEPQRNEDAAILKRKKEFSCESSNMKYMEKKSLNVAPGHSDAYKSFTTVTVSSMVGSYKVDRVNAGVLNWIFKENPDIDKEFKLKCPYFQSVFMNAIAASYRRLESNSENFTVGDSARIREMMKDMELTGLEVTWLNNMYRKRVQEEVVKIEKFLVELDEAVKPLGLF